MIRIEKNIRKPKLIAALIFCLYIFPGMIAGASVMPVYERLQPVTAGVNAPTTVALDNSGNIYVAESINKIVRKYDRHGDLKATLTGFKSPISVAVDDNGRIYVGDKTDGYVAVYDSALSPLFKLGIGNGEFVQPNDIAIDSEGKIYVVDMGTDLVRIYNSNGSFSGSFGGPGSGTQPTPDGKFNDPTSIELAGGEITVLDRGLTYDSYGALVSGARIQKFYPDGSFKSSVNKYGMDMTIGQIYRPQHLAVDSEGRMYVTDSFYNVALVYGNDYAYLGAVFDLDIPLRIPMGITIGGSNKLYIASLTANRVDVFGINPYTEFSAAPLQLAFADELCADPAPQVVDITNNGTAVVNWTASANENWITLSSASGSAPVSGSSALNIGTDLTGLTAGNYSGTVSIIAESGDTETINIDLTAAPVPFTAHAGGVYTGEEGQAITLDGSSSSGCIVSYDWDIGNDGTYEYSSPFPTQGHTFASAGVYDIKLRVTDNAGPVEYATSSANISDSTPSAGFTGSPVTGAAPLIVQFNNNSTGYDQPLAYEWDFDCNGTIDSGDASPSNTYASGTFSVCLTVRDSDGSEEALERSGYITADSGGCQNQPFKIGAVYYPTLQDAYNAATDGITIEGQAVNLTGSLNADRDITISLTGGYDCEFTGSSGNTILNGAITAGNGKLTIENFIVQ